MQEAHPQQAGDITPLPERCTVGGQSGYSNLPGELVERALGQGEDSAKEQIST